jgi:hypothetical protein
MQVEKALSGYVMVCCLEDIPENEMREMLTGGVLHMMMERLTRQFHCCRFLQWNAPLRFIPVCLRMSDLLDCNPIWPSTHT